MKYKVIVTLFLAGLMLPSSAFAHDLQFHKGKPTEGEIVSLDGKSLKLKTLSGVKSTTVSRDTKVGINDSPAAIEDLKKGDM